MSLVKGITGILTWLGHYSNTILVAWFPIVVANNVTDRSVGWIVTTANDTAWVVMAAVLAEILVHGRRLCTRCVHDTPFLNPDPSVQRWKRELRLFHRSRMRVYVMSALLVWAVLMSTRSIPQTGWAYLLDAVVFMVIAYNWLVMFTHRRLKLWCPQCRDDGGGFDLVQPPIPETPASV